MGEDRVVLAVAAALDNYPDVPGYLVALTVANLSDAGGGNGAGGAQVIVDRVAAAMTRAGVRYPVQVEVLSLALGIRIGAGGRGPNVTIPACPYCGAYGGGGHGGFCPGPHLESR